MDKDLELIFKQLADDTIVSGNKRCNKRDSIISQLYNGQIYPVERICPNVPEYQEYNANRNKTLELLKAKFGSECTTLLEKLEELESDIMDLETLAGFKEGLRLGLLMMYELIF